MLKYRRRSHQLVAQILQALDSNLLSSADCFFGGGTQLALAFGEYRESKDIDLLCSSRAGFRKLREQVSHDCLGDIFRMRMPLAREVRADREGIRTFIALDDVRIKFEILLEGRIDLTGALDESLGVPVLSLNSAIAEKFLANTDRGADESVQSRDLIDLAFLSAHVGKRGLFAGLELAEQVYGAAVRRSLADALSYFQRHRSRADGWIKSLRVDDTQTLRKGLRVLRTL